MCTVLLPSGVNPIAVNKIFQIILLYAQTEFEWFLWISEQTAIISLYSSVSQTVVRGPHVVLGFCPNGPFRLNISPKKTEKIKLTWIAYHTLQLIISNRVWKLHTTSVFKLALPGLTFYEIYYPTYSTVSNKKGFSVAKTCFEHCLGQA